MSKVVKVAVGECPEHGVVSHAAVLWRFPCPPECAYCGAELEVAGMVTPDKLQEYKSEPEE